jgi:hypothetical protein
MSTIVTCRNCATRLRVADNPSAGDVCPQCLASLNNPEAAPIHRAPNVLRDVRRDSNTTTVVLWVLFALFAVGVVSAFTIRGSSSGDDLYALMWFLLAFVGLLDAIVLAVTTRFLFRSIARHGSSPTAGQVFGWVFGFIVLALGLAFAGIIFLCASCLAMVTNSHPGR